MENFFIWQNIISKFGMDYSPSQRYNLRINCSDRASIHTYVHTLQQIYIFHIFSYMFFSTIIYTWSIPDSLNFFYYFWLQFWHKILLSSAMSSPVWNCLWPVYLESYRTFSILQHNRYMPPHHRGYYLISHIFTTY